MHRALSEFNSYDCRRATDVVGDALRPQPYGMRNRNVRYRVAMAASRLYELRTYHAAPGRLEDLQNRFRDHTLALFEKHGLDVIGFWVAADKEGQPTETLVYMLAFDDREAADKAWSTFRVDPAWLEARTKSEVHGPLVTGFESVFLAPTDYSPLS
jgi:hypothetical protein